MRKKLIAIAVCLSLFLCGCSPLSYVQYRCVVHAIGIDYKDGEYEVTFQIYSPEKGGSGPQDASQKNVANVKTKGKTMFEAKRNLEHKVGREAFFGIAELVVFGDSMKERDLFECVEFLTSAAEIYPGVDVAVSKKSASELLECELAKNSSSAQTIREAINACVGDGIAMRTTLEDVFNSISNGFDIAVAVIDFKDSKDDYSIDVKSSRILSGARFEKDIDGETVKGLRLLNGDAKDMAILVESNGETVSVNISSLRIKRKVKIINGTPTVKLKICLDASLVSPSDDENINEKINEKILSLCKEAYSNVSPEMLKIEQIIKTYKPRFWRENSENIGEYVKKTVFSIEIASNVEGFR